MGAGTANAARQWKNIIRRLNANSAFELDRFRRAPEMMIFGTFDPKRFGLLYYKLTVRLLYEALPPDAKKILHAVKNRNTGAPHTVRVSGTDVCLDYLLAAYETHFLAEALAGVQHAVEIGAGFGRTCHTILSNFKTIEEYWIIDLDYMLEISHRYLSAVLDGETFSKIRFVPASEFRNRSNARMPSDALFINIDSMPEMSVADVNAYLRRIDRRGRYFYSNNTLGKYNPADVGEDAVRKKDFKDAISAGKTTGVIDIFDDRRTRAEIPDFVSKYRPGETWAVRKEGFAACYPHYYQVLYEKN